MQTIKRIVSVLLVTAMLFSVFAVTTLESSAIAPLPHRVQFDEPWGSVTVGYGTISATGCGILSLVNAVGYLTGKEMDIVETAQWAYSVKGFNSIEGNLGTYRLTLYPKVEAKYGEEYGFTVDCNTNDSGWWLGASSTVLKNHLANGGAAIGNIPGHFIAIVDYNPSTNMFHVLDSAPTSDRGTAENRGDVWLSESHMSTGNYKLSWFCLLSAVGTPADEQDNEREFLGAEIESVKDLRFYNFNSETLNTFRTAYANAVSVYNSDTAESADCTAARNALVSAVNATSAVSVGKSYTATPNDRTDVFKDDGIKLTDGKKGQLPANTEIYSGLGNKQDSVITVDLGASPSAHNTYRVFAASNTNWGIGKPVSVKVSVSDDGSNFKEIASTATVWSVANDGDWTTYVLNLQADANRTERYVRFTVTPDGHTWLDEVEVCGGTAIDLEGAYITAVNKRIASGECNVFTSSFGQCTVSTVNYLYGHSLILKKNASGKYEVTFSGYGKAIEEVRSSSFTLANDELLIVAHDWEDGVTADIVYGSGTNYLAIKSASVGDIVDISGIDVANATCAAASYVNITYNNADPEPNPNLAYQKDYVTSEIYAPGGTALYPDENGVTLTDGKYAKSDSDFSDAVFVGFNVNSGDYKTNGYSSVTVDLSEVYSVKKMVAEVASSYHDSVGINAPSMIEIYVSSDNQSFKKVGYANPVDSDKKSTVSVEIVLNSAVDARYVQFRFIGKSSWIFVSEVEVYSKGDALFYGDVNADGKIDSLDYLLIKRTSFGTYVLDEDELKRADVNGDGKTDSSDYLLIKRIAFDTYIAAAVHPEPSEDETDDTPTVPEIEIPDISNDATYTNVVLNKTYTKSNLHPVDNPSYPDEDNKTMTDGVRASSTASYSDAAFMAFSRSSFDYNANGYSSITVDLGGIHYVDKFVVSTASAKFSKYGIDAPAYVWIYVSNDGNEWYRVGTTPHVDSTSVSTVDCTLKLDKAVSARYVQYRICCNAGGWMFISEVEAFGVKAEQAVSYPQTTADKKILFVGNSTTFFFNIPDKLFFLGEAAGMEIDVEYCCGGGAYLYHYADSTTALGKLFRTKLALKDYDYVVLQDNGNATYEDSKPALDILIPLIEQAGAEVVLYKRYSSNSDPDQRLDSAYRHEQNYTALAAAFGIDKVAPAADAFLICTEKYPSINLYHTDNSHHNATAAYLVACVFAITYLDMDITDNTYTAGLDAATVKALKECATIACKQGYDYNK